MRIITGALRGRAIPFNPKRSGHVRVTSDRLKEAVFDILGSSLEGQAFLDLCAGSGQMALEAHSRGARVTATEPDGRRHGLLKRLVREWELPDFELYALKAQVLMPQLASAGRRFEVAYVDPPYDATWADLPLSRALLQVAGDSDLLEPGGRLFVQHSRRLDLPEGSGSLALTRRRTYGDTDLSEYAPAG